MEENDYLPLFLYDPVPKRQAMTNKCLVLDLDQTLINTQDEFDDLQKLKIYEDPKLMPLRRRTFRFTTLDAVGKKGVGKKDRFWGTFRPHVKEFLIFCFSYFECVVVWSAGVKRYVDEVVEKLFSDIQYPDLVLSRNETRLHSSGNIEKPLEVLYNNDRLGHKMSPENTFILDDRLHVAEYSNPDNIVIIPPYEPSPTIRSLSADDIALQQFMQWLLKDEVKNASDVRKLDKKSIFKTPLTTIPK